MSTKRLTERFSLSSGKVDRAGPRPLIRDVLLCGPTSANRRRYKREAFAGDRVKGYADRPVYLDHGDGRSARRYGDQIGWVRNPRLRADGMPVGDIEVKAKHPLAEALLDDAEHDPKAVGMSHVAHCKTSGTRDGWEEVESVESVESVDVVLDPATTKGLYESQRGTRVAVTIKELCESLVRHPRTSSRQVAPLKRLAEMDGMGEAPTGLDAPPADDADPADGVKDAFRSAVMHVIDQAMSGDLDPKEALAKVKELLASHGKVNGDTAGADTDTDSAEDAEETDLTGESRKGKAKAAAGVAELREAQAACAAAGYANPSLDDLTLLADVPAAQRPGLIARLARTVEGAGAERVTAAGRRPGAGGTAGVARVAEGVPADAKSFAASIRE